MQEVCYRKQITNSAAGAAYDHVVTVWQEGPSAILAGANVDPDTGASADDERTEYDFDDEDQAAAWFADQIEHLESLGYAPAEIP